MQTTAAGHAFAAHVLPAARQAPPRAAQQGPADEVILGNSAPPSMGRPQVATEAADGSPKAQIEAEKASSPAGLPMWMRATAGLMAGLVGMVGLTGCNRGGGTPTGSVPADSMEHPEAEAKLADAFKEIEASMGKSGQDSEAEANSVTRSVIDAVKDYARETGKSAQGVAEDVKDFMVEHPALTVTVMLTVGTVAGVGLEKLGFTDAIGDGLHKVKELASEHKIATALIVTAAAAGTAYLIYQIANTEGDVPEKPTGEAAEALEQTFVELDEQLQSADGNPDAKAEQASQTLMEKIKEYAQKTGKTAAEVANDVKAYAYEHPAVAAAVIISAGVATGVILEHAGVPDKVAGLIGSAFEGSKDGVKSVGNFVKEHPVLSGVVAVGVAAGVGYVVYNYMQPDEAPAPQPGPGAGQTEQGGQEATTG